MVRVIVAGQLPREEHNAPLHLFSASPELVGYGRGAYGQRSKRTSRLLRQLFESLQGEGFAMSYTMADFEHDYIKRHFAKLTPQEQQEALHSLPPKERREILQSLPLEERLAGLSEEEIRKYLDERPTARPTTPRRPRRKK